MNFWGGGPSNLDVDTSCPVEHMVISANVISSVILIVLTPQQPHQRLYCNASSASYHDVTEEDLPSMMFIKMN